jgi:DNA polymerase-4
MYALGIQTCEDLQALSVAQLSDHFGSFGERLFEQCRGIDHREVNNDRITKSLSLEDTYTQDLADLAACQLEIEVLFDGLLKRYDRAKIAVKKKAAQFGREPQSMTPKTLILKMRFSDFATTTAQMSGIKPDLLCYQQLCQRAYARGERPVRLLGLGIAFDVESDDS